MSVLTERTCERLVANDRIVARLLFESSRREKILVVALLIVIFHDLGQQPENCVQDFIDHQRLENQTAIEACEHVDCALEHGDLPRAQVLPVLAGG